MTLRLNYFVLGAIIMSAILAPLALFVPTTQAGDYSCHTQVSPTPTPTEEVTLTPTSTPSTGNGGTPPVIYGSGYSTQSPAVVTCTIGFSPPFIVSYTAGQSGTLTFHYLESDQQIDKFSIIYGYSPTNLQFGADNISPTVLDFPVHDLSPNNHVWAQVWSWKNGCAEKSNIFDPLVL